MLKNQFAFVLSVGFVAVAFAQAPAQLTGERLMWMLGQHQQRLAEPLQSDADKLAVAIEDATPKAKPKAAKPKKGERPAKETAPDLGPRTSGTVTVGELELELPITADKIPTAKKMITELKARVAQLRKPAKLGDIDIVAIDRDRDYAGF